MARLLIVLVVLTWMAILGARFANQDGDFTAIYFETSASRGGYYRPDGSAAQRQFLQAPLNYRRISSQYAASRLHPVATASQGSSRLQANPASPAGPGVR